MHVPTKFREVAGRVALEVGWSTANAETKTCGFDQLQAFEDAWQICG
jgi:hypothetical protein